MTARLDNALPKTVLPILSLLLFGVSCLLNRLVLQPATDEQNLKKSHLPTASGASRFLRFWAAVVPRRKAVKQK